ncbi:MAG: hypothetical protein E6J34_10090 [Chloroflexi bacterium]|nr:MAG: hypothetical protein E6J34_10090 [Chloroflexota bacterium]
MASGNYGRKNPLPTVPIAENVKATIPLRTNRLHMTEPVTIEAEVVRENSTTNAIYVHFTGALKKYVQQRQEEPVAVYTTRASRRLSMDQPHPLRRHKPWVTRASLCAVMAVLFLGVLLSSVMIQRKGPPQLSVAGGMVYDIQVGGTQAGTWQSNEPMEPKVPIGQSGPYAVLGKPTITVDFINRVLADYNSPAAGKGQALYDMGIQYGIDPAYALAFFLHESTLGTQGEARITMSLGNLRCIPDHPCVDKDRGGYAQMASWEDGFKTWYQLIRNYYVAQRQLATVDKIIPVYAPNADHNNEQGYIKALKHYVDTWHAGILRP